jgi:hypothetical protein
MKVLALTRYGRTGASSRMRFHQYLPALAAAGIRVEVAPLFSDGYVRSLQAGQRDPLEIVRGYARRTLQLRQARTFDLLWVEKEALPWLPAGLERALAAGSMRFVLDYDDAVFHHYDRHRHAWVRHLLGNKHPTLMRQASLVIAGNDHLAAFARAAGAHRVETVPTVIDLQRYPAPDFTHHGEPPCIGWIGQRATAPFLTPLASVFKRLTVERRACFRAVGIDAASLGLPMVSVPWREDTEVAAMGAFDIGIMPLTDGPFERGKCGYKLIQYMACGLPVVASPVGVNRQIVEHGVNGFLAETPAQWEKALRTLALDAGLRARMGRAGRRKVEQHYALQVTAPRLEELLRRAARTVSGEAR